MARKKVKQRKSKYGWIPKIIYVRGKKKYEFLLNKKPMSKPDAADVFSVIYSDSDSAKLIMKIGFKRMIKK